MRNQIGFWMLAALVIGGTGCGGVAGLASDALIADALADAVSDAIEEVLVNDILTPAAVDEVEDVVADVRDIIDEVVDSIVEDIVLDVVETPEIPPDSVTVTLVNRSPSYAIEVTVAYDDHNLPLVWLGLGSEETFVLEPGETVSFWTDCDDLQTITIDDADLFVPDGPNRETESRLLNEGIDYECDDEIRFVFDHSDAIRDFDVFITILDENRLPRPSFQDSIFNLFND